MMGGGEGGKGAKGLRGWPLGGGDWGERLKG
jgi:hypothetical protein